MCTYKVEKRVNDMFTVKPKHKQKMKNKFLSFFFQCMQIMGNSRARAVYEANIPEGFRRPQTDSQLDTFIRAKYEKKKYIAREYIPQKAPDLPDGWTALIEAEKAKKDIRNIVLPSHTKADSDESAKRFVNYSKSIYFVVAR